MDHELTSAVNSFYAAMGRRDYAALRSLFHPKVEWNSAENFLYAERNPYVGVDLVLGILRQVDADWSSFSMNVLETFLSGQTAIVRGRYRGKLKGTGFGLDAEFVHVLQFQNGLLVNGRSYTDTAQFRDAVRQLRQPDGSDSAAATPV